MEVLERLNWILSSLRNIDEDNFEQDYPKIVSTMISIRDEIFHLEQNGFFDLNPIIKEKVNYATKLISDEYDNKINLWKRKISEISEMLISSRNEQKVLSYKR
jgi:hypothetical protein